MEFVRRNVNKKLRNGEILAYNNTTYSYSNKNSVGSDSSNMSNYLPATSNGDGTYTVDLTQVIFNGNVIAQGEVAAYKSGLTSGETSGVTSGTIDVEDNLTSERTDAALSANQGRVLKELIDNIDVENLDLSNYYTKAEVNSGYSPISHTHNYVSTVNVGTTSYNVSANTISLPSYPTLSSLSGVSTSAFNSHSADTTVHITAADKTTINNINDWFYKDENNNIHSKYNFIGDSDISAYGSGETGNTSIDLENYYTKDEVDDLIDGIDVGDVDLSGYSKTSHTHSNYSLTSHTHAISAVTNLQSTLDGKSSTSHTHTQYASSSHTHPISAITSLQSTLDGKSSTSHTHSNYSVTSHTHAISAVTNLQSTLDAKATNAALTAHTANTTYHITSNERTKWNEVYTNLNDWFYKDSSGNIHSKYNLIGDSDISAYGSGSTANTEINLENYYTKSEVDDLIDGIDIGDIDLSGYSKTSHTHSNYSLTSHTHSAYASSSHTHPISAVTNLQSSLDAKSGTGHSHSNYSVTSHTHSLSALTSTAHTHPISAITSLQSTLNGKSSTSHTHSNYSVTSHTHSAYATTGHTHSSLTFSGGTFSAKTYNPSGATTVNIPTNTTHLTNGSGYITSAATVAAANKVTSTLTFTGGTFSAKTFNGSGATTVNIPTNTTHLTNGSGYITTAATVTNSDKLDGYHGSSANTASNYVLRGSSGQINVGSISAAGTITATGEVTAYSDARLKDNINTLTNRGYLKPKTYTKDGKESIGFIAQDVQELYPELVIVDDSSEEKYLSLNYAQLTAVLAAQINELKDEIEKLKEIIKNK